MNFKTVLRSTLTSFVLALVASVTMLAHEAQAQIDTTSSKTLRMPTEQFGNLPAAPQPADATVKSADKKPSTAYVKALPISRLSLISNAVGDRIITELKGTATIRSIEPTVDHSTLDFSSLSKVTIVSENLQDCLLTTINLTTNGDLVEILIQGSDAQGDFGSNSCLVKLGTMALTGFSAELENVRLVTPDGTIISTVTLDITTNPALYRSR